MTYQILLNLNSNCLFREDKIIELSKYKNVTICSLLYFWYDVHKGGIRLKEYLDFYKTSNFGTDCCEIIRPGFSFHMSVWKDINCSGRNCWYSFDNLVQLLAKARLRKEEELQEWGAVAKRGWAKRQHLQHLLAKWEDSWVWFQRGPRLDCCWIGWQSLGGGLRQQQGGGDGWRRRRRGGWAGSSKLTYSASSRAAQCCAGETSSYSKPQGSASENIFP